MTDKTILNQSDSPHSETPEDVSALIRSHPLLGLLSASALEAIGKSGRTTRFRQNRTVMRAGRASDEVFCLLSGAVRIYHRAEDGMEVLVMLQRAPSLFGAMEVISGQPFLENAMTLEPSLIYRIPADLYRKLVMTQPAFARAVLTDQAQRLCRMSDNKRALAFFDVDARLASLLIDYANYSGDVQGDNIRLRLPLTQERLAQDLGVSRKSLSRSLSKLKAAGILTKRNARYVIRDITALEARGCNTSGYVHKTDRPLD